MLRLCNVLGQFPFTISQTKLDYYHPELNLRVTLQVAKRPNIRTLGNEKVLRKSLECRCFTVPGFHSKTKRLEKALEN